MNELHILDRENIKIIGLKWPDDNISRGWAMGSSETIRNLSDENQRALDADLCERRHLRDRKTELVKITGVKMLRSIHPTSQYYIEGVRIKKALDKLTDIALSKKYNIPRQSVAYANDYGLPVFKVGNYTGTVGFPEVEPQHNRF